MFAGSGCNSSPQIVDTTLSDAKPTTEATASAVPVEAGTPMSLPDITDAWLVGTWGPAGLNPGNSPQSSCETDVILTFMADGTFADGGAEGQYSTDGTAIQYVDRATVPDIAADLEEPFEPEKLTDVTTLISAVDENTFEEDGEQWRRCISS